MGTGRFVVGRRHEVALVLATVLTSACAGGETRRPTPTTGLGEATEAETDTGESLTGISASADGSSATSDADDSTTHAEPGTESGSQSSTDSGNELPESCTEKVRRVVGGSTYEAAAALSQARFPSAAAAVLVRGDSLTADAIGAGSLAAHVGGPVLLTAPDSLHADSRAELLRLAPDVVYVVGGTVAISDTVTAELVAEGLAVERLPGVNRFETAAALASQIGPSPLAFIVSGDDLSIAEGLVAAGPAAGLGAPVLLVTQSSIPGATANALVELGVSQTIVVGSPDVISDAVLAALPDPVRVAGVDRLATAVLVAEEAIARGLPITDVFITAVDAVEAMAASALGQPLLLTQSDALDPAVASFLSTEATTATLLGGTEVVSAVVETQICSALP